MGAEQTLGWTEAGIRLMKLNVKVYYYHDMMMDFGFNITGKKHTSALLTPGRKVWFFLGFPSIYFYLNSGEWNSGSFQ